MLENSQNNTIKELIQGYLENTLSSDQKEFLREWIRADKANRRYFDEQKELWAVMQSVSCPDKYNYAKGFKKFNAIVESEFLRNTHRKYAYLLRLAKIAALLILTFFLGGMLFYNMGRKQTQHVVEGFNSIIVPKGAKIELLLSDGTSAILNAESKLTYSSGYGSTGRMVQIEGEGYFKVAENKNLPFIVHTSHLDIIALGTEFNVKSYPDDNSIEATLVKGSVRINTLTDKEKTNHLVLKPDQKVIYNKDKPDEGLRVENIDTQFATSWKEDRWIIEMQSLGNLAVELERKYNIEIAFASESLKNYRFTGTLVDEPIEQVLKMICFTAPISYRIEGKNVLLYNCEP